MFEPIHRAPRVSIPLVLALALCVACQVQAGSNSRPTQKSDPLEVEESELTVRALQAGVLSYSDVFSATVSATADDIAAATEDREIREMTLRWKLRTIPSMREATSDVDPRRAVLDAWVMTVRLSDFLEDGAGRSYFGPQQDLAREAMAALTERIEGVVRELLTEDQLVAARADVDALAAGRPMTGRFAADLLRSSRDVEEDLHPGVFGLLSFRLTGVAEGAAAIDRVAQVLAVTTEVIEALPEETRWQSELLMLEFEKLAETDPAIQSLVRLSEAAATLPADLRRELEAALAASEGPLAKADEIARELRAAMEAAGPVVATLDETTAKLAEAAVTWESVATEVRAILEVTSAPDDEPGSGDGFSLEELTKTGDAVHAGAAELRALLDEAGSSELSQTTDARFRELLDQVTLRAAALIAFFLVGLYLVRRTTRRSD